jgi:hypothetical protein
MTELRATVTVHSRAGDQRVDLPPGSAAWLYHLTAEAAVNEAMLPDGSPREDVPLSRLNVLRGVGQDSAVCRDLLLVSQQSPTGIAVDVLGGSAATALFCLRWTAAEHARIGADLPGDLGAAVRARADHLAAWADLASTASNLQHPPASAPHRVTGWSNTINIVGFEGDSDQVRLECCALYSALVLGAVRMVAQAGPPAIPFASMLATDLSLMAGLDGTRQRADPAPSLVVAGR